MSPRCAGVAVARPPPSRYLRTRPGGIDIARATLALPRPPHESGFRNALLTGAGGAALVVPVRVNGGGPYDFVLDTGATLTCVDRALADSLGLPEARGALGVGAGIRSGPGAMRLVEIDSLSVGGARAEGLTGCTLDLEQFRALGLDARGLLGLNFLREFRVTLDFDAGRLTLVRP